MGNYSMDPPNRQKIAEVPVEIAGSNPAPATKRNDREHTVFFFYVIMKAYHWLDCSNLTDFYCSPPMTVLIAAVIFALSGTANFSIGGL